MYQFIFDNSARVLFGAGQLNHLHEEKLPGKKALIATSNGSSTKKFGYLARLEKELDLAGVEYVLFDQIRPNPTDKNVMEGAKIMRDQNCDFIIALGGGSVMDASKCIALMAANDGDLWDYSFNKLGGKKNPDHDAFLQNSQRIKEWMHFSMPQKLSSIEKFIQWLKCSRSRQSSSSQNIFRAL